MKSPLSWYRLVIGNSLNLEPHGHSYLAQNGLMLVFFIETLCSANVVSCQKLYLTPLLLFYT